MIARSLLSQLFEPRRHRSVYRSLSAELDAVRDGRKPIAMEVWPVGELDDEHAEFVALASTRGLSIVERRDVGRAGIPILAVYALRGDQTWRIDALHALWRTYTAANGAWSDGAEALESTLLGYTPAQIEGHLAAKRHERIGWRGATIYVLLGRADRRLILDGRWFPHTRATAVWCDGTRIIKRKPPAWVARQGLAVARAAIVGEQFLRIFGRRGWLRSRVVDPAELNPMLESRIQILGVRGWR